MKLIIGLGNPGASYSKNRHNLGFMALDKLAEHYQVSTWQNKFNSHFASISSVQHQTILLLKPQGYMNLSGQAVLQCMSFYKIPLSSVYVMHDDLDIELGKIRLKTGGGHGGHNGLRSIDQLIGANYHRARLGIGRPPMGYEVSNYVLGDFRQEEGIIVAKMLDFLLEYIDLILTGQFDKFSSKQASLKIL